MLSDACRPFVRLEGTQCDGHSDDTSSLQRTLHSCGTLHIDEGANCTTRPLVLPSSSWIHLERGGVLQAAHRVDWPDGGSNDATPMLSSSGTHNLTITGGGVMDGRGEEWWAPWPISKLLPDSWRPKLLELTAVESVRLLDFTIVNPARFAIDIVGGRDYIIHRLKIRAPNFQIAPNTDGIDIAATNVHVRQVDVANGDDSICIKSPAANVLVEDSVVRNGNGLVVGTAYDVAIHNVTFRNCTALDTTFGCHIKFHPPEAGAVSNVTFEDITISQTAASTWRRVLHGDHAGYALGIHMNDQGRRRQLSWLTSAVRVANVTYRRVRAEGIFAGEFYCGTGELACVGLQFEDVHINASRGGCRFENAFGSSDQVTPPSCALQSQVKQWRSPFALGLLEGLAGVGCLVLALCYCLGLGHGTFEGCRRRKEKVAVQQPLL
mmetsp:Transcript_47951/g.111084  ORF Transcript_47951/g.111084 Transcript_47951/m.111084 type:complete len:436 (-) Transcript_47951:376-1683(-)